MTKKELLELLEKYPDDAVIACLGRFSEGLLIFRANDVFFNKYKMKFALQEIEKGCVKIWKL